MIFRLTGALFRPKCNLRSANVIRRPETVEVLRLLIGRYLQCVDLTSVTGFLRFPFLFLRSKERLCLSHDTIQMKFLLYFSFYEVGNYQICFAYFEGKPFSKEEPNLTRARQMIVLIILLWSTCWFVTQLGDKFVPRVSHLPVTIRHILEPVPRLQASLLSLSTVC